MNNENKNSLHQILKSQTTDLHKEAHNIPYIANLLNNNIQLKSYWGHLQAFSIIYEALENQILNQEIEPLNDFLVGYSPKLPLLLKDLEYLKARDLKDIVPAIDLAGNVADKILFYSKESPYKILGFIYTLEGSINGGSILKKHLIQTFNFENNQGTTYLSCSDDRFNKYWAVFINSLNTKITNNKYKDDVISAASEIFIDLMKIYKSLSLVDKNTVV